MRRLLGPALAAALVALTLVAIAGAAASTDSLVTVGSPSTPFPQNKQNEPAVAIDAHQPNIVAAGANEEIDVQPCPATAPDRGSRCPFTQGVGTSGIYFSTDGGVNWTQPTYTGYTARTCTAASCVLQPPDQPAAPGKAGRGPIGTLPNYVEAGLVSDGDPSLAFGPRPGANGTFSWANGSRLYYANLTANFSTVRSEEAFKGFEAIAVSHTDNIAGAIAGQNSAWSAPVIATRQNAALFSDKEQVWADNAATSKYFGNVYLCNASFRGNGRFQQPEPIVFVRSTDGGETWSAPRQLSQAANNSSIGGRQGCTVRTDSAGVVYVFWEGGDPKTKQSAQLMARSFDGGVSFERPRIVAPGVVDVGAFDPVDGDLTFDGIAGSRTDSYPSVDIANGAPSGRDATNEIVMGWSDARDAVPSPYACCAGTIAGEKALVQYSTNRGETWSAPSDGTAAGDRPDFSAVAITPNGTDVYLVYDAFLQPWQLNTTTPRLMQGVVRHASPTLTGWTTLHRGATGDARGSSANALFSEFLGDYNYVAAMRLEPDHLFQLAAPVPPTFAVAVWNDTRNADDCTLIDTFRQADFTALTTNTTEPTPPWPGACANRFGNSDIYGGQYTPSSTP